MEYEEFSSLKLKYKIKEIRIVIKHVRDTHLC